MTKRVADNRSLLDRVKIQSEVLVPVLRRLRAEIGTERANALVAEALRDWSRSVQERIAADVPGEGWEKLGALMQQKAPAIGDAVNIEWGTVDVPERMEFKITRCAYAEFFRALDEPALGALLTCESDLHEVAAVGNGLELERPQTIMQGAPYCDFRYKMVKGGK